LRDTPSPPHLSIVIPTYNEKDRLPALVSAIVDACRTGDVACEIVVVDDNSPDGTGRIADDLAEHHPLTVLHRAGKLGLGTAVIEGFNAARADVVGVMDADLSHPAAALPSMLAAMRRAGADMVIGSRYIPGGGTSDWGVGRLAMSRFACLLASGLTPVSDATSGFFLVRKNLARSVTISAGGFKICLELLVRGRPATVVEVPYVFQARTAGESKMNLREAIGYLDQLKNLWAFKRAQPPLVQRYERLTADPLPPESSRF
jgi:dolichol-phosphate mannosyltransferase